MYELVSKSTDRADRQQHKRQQHDPRAFMRVIACRAVVRGVRVVVIMPMCVITMTVRIVNRVLDMLGKLPARLAPEGQEHQANPRRDHLASDVSDAATALSDAHHERAEVVDGAHEDRAQDDPYERRKHAPVGGDARPDDRRGAGDRREVVAEQDVLVRGYEVQPILVLDGRRQDLLAILVNPFTDPLRVEEVRECKREKHAEDDEGHHSPRSYLEDAPFSPRERVPEAKMVRLGGRLRG